MKVLVPLAQGFEEIEAVTIIDILRRAHLDVVTAATGSNPVRGSHHIEILCDKLIDEVNIYDFDLIVLPGGQPGANNLRDDPRIITMIKQMNDKTGYIGAICAAPIVLGKAGVISGKKVTVFPGYENEIDGGEYTGDPVTVDRRIITGKGAGCAVEFSLKLVEQMLGLPAAEKIKSGLQVYWM